MANRSKSKRLIIGLLVSLSVLIPFLVHGFYLGRSNPDTIALMCSKAACKCEDWYRGSSGPYLVENNVWNKEKAGEYQQCVYIYEDNDGFEAGWAWNWPGIRFNVVAYPNIIYGKNPWLPAISSDLPMQIGDIQCLEAEFEVTQEGSGKGNLAFDLWVTDNASSQPENITHEIMVWLSHDGFGSGGQHQDTLDFDGSKIRFYKKVDHNPSAEYSWTYLAFVYPSDLTQGPIDLNAFLDYLVANGHLSADSYLSGVQLGNEIVSGYGRTLVRNYEIQLCGE